MVRRVMVLVFGAVLLLFPGIAIAQESPPSTLPSSTVQQATTTQQVAGARLSRTGTDVLPLVIVGAGLAGAGTVLVVAARRRRDQAAAA